MMVHLVDEHGPLGLHIAIPLQVASCMQSGGVLSGMLLRPQLGQQQRSSSAQQKAHQSYLRRRSRLW